MPTANGNTGNGFSKAISYALQETKDLPEQERAVVLEVNNIYGTSQQMGRQMRFMADERERVSKPVLHLQINFHPDEKLSQGQAQAAIDAILKEVGINKESHQYVVAQHRDKAHDHYHVVANRVGLDGSLVEVSYLKNKLQVACDKVEKEQGLRPTQGRTVIYDPTHEKGFRFATKEEKLQNRAQLKPVIDKNPKVAEVKTDIRKELESVLSKKETQTPDQLLQALKEKGIEVKFTENKNGISGVSFRTDDIAVKGSAVGYKWSEINKALETNKAKIQAMPAPVQVAAVSAEVQTTEKPVLSEAIKHKMLLYIEQNPEKISSNDQLTDQAIRIYMKEVKPYQNPWDTWEAHQDHKEQREIFNKCATIVLSEAKATEATAQYNGAFKGIVDEFNAEVAKGNVNFDLDQMIRRNLQIVQNYHPVLQEYVEEHIPKIETAQQDLIKQLSEYKRQLENYELLMSAEREKITLKTTILLENPEIERRNQELEKRKAEAIKPEFKPQVTLSVADFTKTSRYIDPQRVEVRKLVVKANISAVLSKQETQTPEKLRQGLKERGIEVKYSENASGISNTSFQIKETTFRGFEVGFDDTTINKALEVNKPLKSAEIDNSQAYRAAVIDTINQFKKEAEAGNINFDVKAMFEENIKKHIPEPDAATTQKMKVALPEFQNAQQKVINQYITHQKERPNEVFKPTVQLYERNLIKSSTFKDEEKELIKGISEITKQVQARNQEPEEQKKSQGRRM